MHEGKMSKLLFAVRIHEAFTRYQVLKNEKEIFFVSPSFDTNCNLTGTVHGRKFLKDSKNVQEIFIHFQNELKKQLNNLNLKCCT